MPGADQAIVDGFIDQGKHRRFVEKLEGLATAFMQVTMSITLPVILLAPLAAGLWLIIGGAVEVGALIAISGAGLLIRVGWVNKAK